MLSKDYKLWGVKLIFKKVLEDTEIKDVIVHYTLFFNLEVYEVLKGLRSTTIIFETKED